MSLCRRPSLTSSPGVIDTVSLLRLRLFRIRCFSNSTRLGSTTGDDEFQTTSKVIADLSKVYRSRVRNRRMTAQTSRSTVSPRRSVKRESIIRKVHLGQGPASEPTSSLQSSTHGYGLDRGSLLSCEDEKHSGTPQIRKYLYELPFDRRANPVEIPLKARHSPETEETRTCDPVLSRDNSKDLATGNGSSSKTSLRLAGKSLGESPPICRVSDRCSMIRRVPYISPENTDADIRKHVSFGQGQAKPDALGDTVHAAAFVITQDLGESHGRDMIAPAQIIANDQQTRQEAILGGTVRSMVSRSYYHPDEVDSNPMSRIIKATDQAEQGSSAQKVDMISLPTIRNVDHPGRKDTEPMIRKYTFNDQKPATQDTSLGDVDKGFNDLLYSYNQLQLRKPLNQAKDNAVEWASRKKYQHWQRSENNAEAIEKFGKAVELISQSIDLLNEDLKDLDVVRDIHDEFSENPYVAKATGRWPRAHDGPRKVLSAPKVLESRIYVGSETPRITFVYELPATAVTTT